MSYLRNFPLKVDDDDESENQEMAIETNFHLTIPDEIFIDLPINEVESCGNVDPLGDLDGVLLEDAPTPATFTIPAAEPLPPEVPPNGKNTPQYYHNISVFNSEMKKDIEEIISESVHLFEKDPREYHPFYLRVLKYLTIGQQLGHLPQGKHEDLKFWKKYDEMAVKQWENRKKYRKSFSGEESPYATYIRKKKVYINGQLMTDKRKRQERDRNFSELERKARNILKENPSSSSCDIRSNLELRLKFLCECFTMTYPGDCLRMNTLWAKFCSNFGNATIRLPEELEEDAPVFSNNIESSTKQPVVLTVQIVSPDPLNLPSFSPPPSPLVEETEQKYEISLELEKSKGKCHPDKVTSTRHVPGTIVKCKEKKADVVPKTKRKVNLSRIIPKTKNNNGTQKGMKLMKAKSGKQQSPNKVSKTRLKTRLKKSKLIQPKLSVARKVLKKRLKHIPLKHDKILSVLEKKINTITKKLNSKPLSKASKPVASQQTDAAKTNSQQTDAAKSNSQLPTEAVKSATPEFSMCEDCGQTYRTHYLSVHKDAVHNPSNFGKACLLCSTFFKSAENLWSHFLTHMPNHLNPSTIAMQVVPVVEERETSNENSTNKQTANIKDSEPSGLEQDKSWDCPHCNGKPFATKGTLQRHLHLVHGEGNLPDNKLVCSDCPKSFKEKAALTQHIKSFHQGIQNVCEICGKRFQSPGKLWKHRVDYHGIISNVPTTNRGSVQCENCGENCLQGKQFINHVRNHHPEMLDDVLRQEKERRKEKAKELKKMRIRNRKQDGIKLSKEEKARRASRTCPECGKFLKAGGLSRHLKQTHGSGIVKTYCCPNAGCDKQYKTRVSLRIHISQTHDPLRDKISQKQLIKTHYDQVEPGVKSFQCTLCGWMVESKYECMMHLVLAHPHCFKEEGVAGDLVKCPHCEETGQDSDQIRNHVELVHSEDVWRCPHSWCKMVILSPVDLQEHFYKIHGDKGGQMRANSGNSKRDRSNWKKSRRKLKGETGQAFKSAFPCFRCKNVEKSSKLLDMHVKKDHVEAYWPCNECGVMCFSEKSKLFHQSVVCKVKKQKVTTKNGVVGYDQMIMECPICKRKMKMYGLSRHLNAAHGLLEDGELWKCGYCKEDEQGHKFRTREYWLAHMDDRHGGEVNMEELIELAKKINSKEEVDIEKITKAKQRKHASKLTKKTCRPPKRGNVNRERKTRSGRVIKRKKAYSDESEDMELSLEDTDDDDDKNVEKLATKRKIGTRQSQRINAHKVFKLTSEPRDNFDLDEIMSNVPLKIRKMFDKQCSVRVERLTMAEIELKRSSIINIKAEREGTMHDQ